MSKRNDGRAFELWTRDLFRDWGWSAKACGRKAMMIKGRMVTAGDDIFGCDVVAVKPESKTRFIQCTLDSGVGKRLDEIQKYNWNLECQQIELWQKKPNGAVMIQHLVQRFDGTEFTEAGRIIRRKFYALGRV